MAAQWGWLACDALMRNGSDWSAIDSGVIRKAGSASILSGGGASGVEANFPGKWSATRPAGAICPQDCRRKMDLSGPNSRTHLDRRCCSLDFFEPTSLMLNRPGAASRTTLDRLFTAAFVESPLSRFTMKIVTLWPHRPPLQFRRTVDGDHYVDPLTVHDNELVACQAES